MVQCPSCGRPQAPLLSCPDCQAPLAANLDFFAAVGLPRKLRLDVPRLEATYHTLGRRLHPDRFASAPVKVRDASLRTTALLTRAYRTLRDPLTRASYWLELEDAKPDAHSQQVPAEVTDLVFDVQEELAQVRDLSARQTDEQARMRQRVNERRAEIVDVIERLSLRLEACFGALDEVDRAASAAMIGELRTILAETAYLRTLLRDIDKVLDNRAAA
jgi:molecular chaperone HscB